MKADIQKIKKENKIDIKNIPALLSGDVHLHLPTK